MAVGCGDEKLASDEGDKCCRVDNVMRGVLFKRSLFEELTVVSSLSGVGFLELDVVVVSVT